MFGAARDDAMVARWSPNPLAMLWVRCSWRQSSTCRCLCSHWPEASWRCASSGRWRDVGSEPRSPGSRGSVPASTARGPEVGCLGNRRRSLALDVDPIDIAADLRNRDPHRIGDGRAPHADQLARGLAGKGSVYVRHRPVATSCPEPQSVYGTKNRMIGRRPIGGRRGSAAMPVSRATPARGENARAPSCVRDRR